MIDLKSLFGGKKDKKTGFPQNKFDEKIKFAMWWPSDKDEDFLKSKGMKLIRGLYKEMDGIETYMFGHLMNMFSPIKDTPLFRVDLPKDGRAMIYVDEKVLGTGNRGRLVMICVSKEKGIQFKFNPHLCSPEIREGLLSNFLKIAKDKRSFVMKKKHPLDAEDEKSRGPEWLDSLIDAFKKHSKEGDTMTLGLEI